VAPNRDFPRDIGEFIRDLRRNARISLRQLAEQAGVSNPYLSQIERGLRKPSAEVLAQLAGALRVSTPLMYLRAGLLSSHDGQGVLAAIAGDPDLTIAQKQSLTQIYETFRRENARLAGEAEQAHGPRRIEIEVPGRPEHVPEHASPADVPSHPDHASTSDATATPQVPTADSDTPPTAAAAPRRKTAAKRTKAGAPAAKAAAKRARGTRSAAGTPNRPTETDNQDLPGAGSGPAEVDLEKE
jgi:transcriptional regulator with XRE-family HTH domain